MLPGDPGFRTRLRSEPAAGCSERRVRETPVRTTRRAGALTLLTLLLATGFAASAKAAAGTVSKYPIPVETTPRGIAAGPDGKIWFFDSGNHVGGTFVGRMATNGAIASSDVVKLPSSSLGLAGTAGPDGNMWVLQGSEIAKLPVGATTTSEVTPYTPGGSGAIVSGPDGRLWFGAETHVGAIATGGVITDYETKFTTGVSAVAVGPEGKIWYAEENKIARMDTSGKTDAGDEFPLPAGEGYINGLVLGPDGNIWFSLGLPAAVGRITPTGTITIFRTPTLNSLPFGLAVGPDKQIWFAERNADAIGAIPTSAASGADIAEYPVGIENAGVLYIAAGPDSRMWFSEANVNALGAITTGTAATAGETPLISPIGTSTPPGTSPPPGVAPPPPPYPSRPPVVGCSANRLILTDVFPQAGKTQVLGVAPAAAIGKTVTIRSAWNGRPVATPTVRADLSFTATVPLPPLYLRFTNRALYYAKFGLARSGALKFSRRMYTRSVTASGRAIAFSGSVTRPFAKHVQSVIIRASASCAAIDAATIVAKVPLTASGAFSSTFQLPGSLQSASRVYLIAQTRVRQNTHSTKTYSTSTLIRGILLR